MEPFKRCGSCGRVWAGWSDFVLDRQVRLVGLQASPDYPDANLFVYEHRCGTSVSVPARRLRHLLGPAAASPWSTIRFGSETCAGHCRSTNDMATCDRPCANARDRRLLPVLQEIARAGRLPETTPPEGPAE